MHSVHGADVKDASVHGDSLSCCAGAPRPKVKGNAASSNGQMRWGSKHRPQQVGPSACLV